MIYKISDDLVIEIFLNDGDEYPLHIQQSWPEGEPWADLAEAEEWANVFIESLLSPDAPLPGSNPEQKTIPREYPVAVEEAVVEEKSVTVEPPVQEEPIA